MKVIIAGGRNFNDFEKLCQVCDRALSKQTKIEIVSGKQRTIHPVTGESYGADYLGEQYALARGYPVKGFPAEWDKYGRGAGYKRNAQMASYADALIAFWDGESKGTKHMIDLANKANMKIKINYY